jgi:hypothetical protein
MKTFPVIRTPRSLCKKGRNVVEPGKTLAAKLRSRFKIRLNMLFLSICLAYFADFYVNKAAGVNRKKMILSRRQYAPFGPDFLD